MDNYNTPDNELASAIANVLKPRFQGFIEITIINQPIKKKDEEASKETIPIVIIPEGTVVNIQDTVPSGKIPEPKTESKPKTDPEKPTNIPNMIPTPNDRLIRLGLTRGVEEFNLVLSEIDALTLIEKLSKDLNNLKAVNVQPVEDEIKPIGTTIDVHEPSEVEKAKQRFKEIDEFISKRQEVYIFQAYWCVHFIDKDLTEIPQRSHNGNEGPICVYRGGKGEEAIVIYRANVQCTDPYIQKYNIEEYGISSQIWVEYMAKGEVVRDPLMLIDRIPPTKINEDMLITKGMLFGIPDADEKQVDIYYLLKKIGKFHYLSKIKIIIPVDYFDEWKRGRMTYHNQMVHGFM